MSNISWNEIQDRAVEFSSRWEGETYEKGEAQSFWSDFLNIFGIDRRRHGAYFEYAIKKGSGKQGFIDMFWPGKLLAEQKSGGRDLGKAGIQAYEYLETMPDHDLPEAIVVCDFGSFIFIKNDGSNQKVEFNLKDLSKNVKLFGFLINADSKHIVEESPVNRSAAESIAEIHNKLKDENYTGSDLELLLVRLVFCMFADDSGIFEHNALQNYIETRTSIDGSDLGSRLMHIFDVLNTKVEDRQSSLDEAILSLPYVNGGLFSLNIKTPAFSSRIRKQLLKAMDLDWSKVSPAIFGSMFQGVMDEKQRRNLGAHYTSEKNILRVIKPLFLDDLYKEFAEAASAGPRKKIVELRRFQDKLANLKFLDPACGCGNFLVITYRELRRLEHKVVAMLSVDRNTVEMLATGGEGVGTLKVNVDQMYGIEIEEFPSLIAQTALWLTDHQMNMEYSKQSGKTFKRLPLIHSAKIVNDNALTKDWAEVVDPLKLNYILGNPPFVGSRIMNKEQKKDLLAVVGEIKQAGFLDFVAGWYFKSAELMCINKEIRTALVSTNSISQGEQSAILWKPLLEKSVHIDFAHQTFKWSNDAKGNAAVYCVIIGFSLAEKSQKVIFEYADIKDEPNPVFAKNINPYLIDAPNMLILGKREPLSDVMGMTYGNMPADGGFLIFDSKERERILNLNPETGKFIHRLLGGKELLNGGERWCLWLKSATPTQLRKMPLVLEKVDRVRQVRLNSSRPNLAEIPSLFAQITCDPNEYKTAIAIPRISSERRDYIPMAFLDNTVVVTDLLQMIPNANLYHFGVLTSNMHMAWMRTVAGRLKSDYRYSKDIVYNNFVWPEVNEADEQNIEKLAQVVLDAREEFPEASLADLYDPLSMPPNLAKAHKQLDRGVDKLYSKSGFKNDSERVALLFKLYEQKTAE